MDEKIKEIRDLNDICKRDRYGIYKQWIYKKEDYMKMCDYMQKINYSLQDLNYTLKELNKFDRKNVVYIISLVDWIREAVNAIVNIINPKVLKNFQFSKQEKLKKYVDYFKAIRSFVVAHPLGTTNHSGYGFDGDFICIDIRDFSRLLPVKDEKREFHIDTNGLHQGLTEKEDFYLYCYNDKTDNMKYFNKIGCYYKDIYNTAQLYIDKLYELDKYLVKNIKRKDYE